MASSVVGTATMLRARRRDVNVKPNRRLDRKSSRGMLYENEELRLRTININAEVERGQSDIKKLRRENDQLRREIWSLREEYDRLESLLDCMNGASHVSPYGSLSSLKKHYENNDDSANRRGFVENEQNLQNITCFRLQNTKSCSKVEFENLDVFDTNETRDLPDYKTSMPLYNTLKNVNVTSVLPEEKNVLRCESEPDEVSHSWAIKENELSCNPLPYEFSPILRLQENNVCSQALLSLEEENADFYNKFQNTLPQVLSKVDHGKCGRQFLKPLYTEISENIVNSGQLCGTLSLKSDQNLLLHNTNYKKISYKTRNKSIQMSNEDGTQLFSNSQCASNTYYEEDSFSMTDKSTFLEGGNLDDLLSDVRESHGVYNCEDLFAHCSLDSEFGCQNEKSCGAIDMYGANDNSTIHECEEGDFISSFKKTARIPQNSTIRANSTVSTTTNIEENITIPSTGFAESPDVSHPSTREKRDSIKNATSQMENLSELQQRKWISRSEQSIVHSQNRNNLLHKTGSLPPLNQLSCFTCATLRRAGSLEISNSENTNSKKDVNNASYEALRNKRNSMPHVNIKNYDKLKHADVSQFEIDVIDQQHSLHHKRRDENIKQCLPPVKKHYESLVQLHNGKKFHTGERHSKYSVKEQFGVKSDVLNCYFSQTNLNNRSQSEICVSPDHIIPGSNTNGKHYLRESLHKMSVLVGNTQQGKSIYFDHSFSTAYWENEERCRGKHKKTCPSDKMKKVINGKKKICIPKNLENVDSFEEDLEARPRQYCSVSSQGVYLHFITEDNQNLWDRANSVCSISSVMDGRFNGHKRQQNGQFSDKERRSNDESVPWCGCWGNGCI